MVVDVDRLLSLIREQGKTAHSVSREAGLSGSAVRDIIRSTRRNSRVGTVSALARVLGVPPETLMVESAADTTAELNEQPDGDFIQSVTPTGSLATRRTIAILGLAEDGLWRESASPFATSVGSQDVVEVDVAGYESAPLAAVRVGSNQGLASPPRWIAIYSAAEAVDVRLGDHVLVERRRGDLVERTIRKVGGTSARPVLLSCNPEDRDREPMPYPPETGEGEDIRVVGVVVADYAARDRSGVPINR